MPIDPRFHYSQRVCPKLSALAWRAEEPSILTPGPEGAGQRRILPTVPCLGPGCMHFVPDADADGNIVNGSCADTLTAIASYRQANALERQAALLERRGPAAVLEEPPPHQPS